MSPVPAKKEVPSEISVFSQASKSLSAKSLQIINVFGVRGIGKSRLVHEVSEFMRIRHYYGRGVFKIDLSKVQDFEKKINEVIPSDKMAKVVEADPSTPNLEFKAESFQQKHSNDVLLILENCDDFINRNMTSFFLNLDCLQIRIPTLQVIFTSEEPLGEDHNIKSFKLPSLNFKESLTFLLSVNPAQQKILRSVKVNPALPFNCPLTDLVNNSGGSP